MNCVVCHGDEIVLREVTEDITRGDDIVRIPLRTMVCADCGERYYDRATLRRLEQMRTEVRENTADLHPVGQILVCKS